MWWHACRMDIAKNTIGRAARSTDSVGMQTDSPKKSVELSWKTHKGGGRIMSFGDQELIRFFKQKTMQHTRSRWRGHAH